MAEARIEEILRREPISAMETENEESIPGTAKLREVISIMQKRRVAAVVVVEGDQVVGIFTERDVLNRIIGLALNEDTPISEVMTRNPRTLTPDQPMAHAVRLMTERGYRHIPLVESDGSPCGMISARDIVEFIAEHYPKEIFNLPPELDQVPPRQEGG